MASKTSMPEVEPTPDLQEKLHQDLYREIFKHSPEPIAIISLQGVYLEQNAAHAELLGYSDDELKDQTPALHVGEKEFANILREIAEKGEYRGEVKSKTKTGELKYIDLSAFAMFGESGEPVCYVGTKRDITRRKQAEQALQRRED